MKDSKRAGSVQALQQVYQQNKTSASDRKQLPKYSTETKLSLTSNANEPSSSCDANIHQPVNKFIALYGKRILIIVSTRVRHGRILHIFSRSLSLTSISLLLFQLRLGLSSSLSNEGFRLAFFHELLICSVYEKCPPI